MPDNKEFANLQFSFKAFTQCSGMRAEGEAVAKLLKVEVFLLFLKKRQQLLKKHSRKKAKRIRN